MVRHVNLVCEMCAKLFWSAARENDDSRNDRAQVSSEEKLSTKGSSPASSGSGWGSRICFLSMPRGNAQQNAQHAIAGKQRKFLSNRSLQRRAVSCCGAYEVQS